MKRINDIAQIDFKKLQGLVPAVIQDNETLKVLMVGFMNEDALIKTLETGKVTFFSRSKKTLYTKGEESDNYLDVQAVGIDCDNDTLLVKVNSTGPVCQNCSDTCFEEENKKNDVEFLSYLQDFIDKRKLEMPDGSYTTSLFAEGTPKIAQKVGEEAIETIIGAMNEDDENFLYESGDLIYHLIVLLSHKGYRIEDIIHELKRRHK